MKRSPKAPKSYRGCQRCKTRKVKCDETEPQCQACVKSGVACPGYAPQFKWSQKHEKLGRLGRRRDSGKADESASRAKLQQQLMEPQQMQRPLSSGDGPRHAERPLTSAVQDALHIASQDHQPPEVGPFGQSPNGIMAPWTNPTLMPLNLEFPDPSTDLEAGRSDDFSYLDPAMLNNFPLMNLPFPADESTWHLTDFDQTSFDTAVTALQRNVPTPPTRKARITSTSASTTPNSTQAAGINQLNLAEDRNSPGNLLGTFYRLASPTTMPQFSHEHLIKHYFDSVCSLCSCFDSDANPFRYVVNNLWSTSTTISLAVQSMAIAHLSNYYMYMAPLGRVKRWQAYRSLQRDLQLHRANKIPLEHVLMSLLLLGLSSSWEQPSNLGLQYLSIARNIMQTYLYGNQYRPMQATLDNDKFYLDALMYWEMQASFVDPVPMMSFPGFGAPVPELPVAGEKKTPHPWTGITTELSWALAEVGRIIRRGVRRNGTKTWVDGDERWAGLLEDFLHRLPIAQEQDILDYGDDNTTRQDLIRTSDLCRYVCLMEIYWAFPSLLQSRARTEDPFPAANDGPFDLEVHDSGYSTEAWSWLCAISIRTLDIIDSIPIASGVCRMQPLFLAACATHLRLPNTSVTPRGGDESTYEDQVLAKRFEVETRMLGLSRRYPQRKMLQILDIIKEVWSRLDNVNDHAHWLDIAHEKGWQTMMG